MNTFRLVSHSATLILIALLSAAGASATQSFNHCGGSPCYPGNHKGIDVSDVTPAEAYAMALAQGIVTNTTNNLSFSVGNNPAAQIQHQVVNFGPTGVRGYTYYYPTFCSALLNSFYTASMIGEQQVAINIHELGHCLGLGHNTFPTEVMWPSTPNFPPGSGSAISTPEYRSTLNLIY